MSIKSQSVNLQVDRPYNYLANKHGFWLTFQYVSLNKKNTPIYLPEGTWRVDSFTSEYQTWTRTLGSRWLFQPLKTWSKFTKLTPPEIQYLFAKKLPKSREKYKLTIEDTFRNGPPCSTWIIDYCKEWWEKKPLLSTGRVSSTEKNSAIEGTDRESFIFMRSLQEQEPIDGLLRRPWIFIMVKKGGRVRVGSLPL